MTEVVEETIVTVVTEVTVVTIVTIVSVVTVNKDMCQTDSDSKTNNLYIFFTDKRKYKKKLSQNTEHTHLR